MRLAHLSDLHVTDGARLVDQQAVLQRAVADALICRPDCWLLTGDLYGREVPHRSTPRERAVLYPQVARMSEIAPVVVLYGNHDLAPDLDTLRDVGAQWPVHVIDGAKALDIATPAGTLHLYGLAYPTKAWLLRGEDRPPGVAEAQAMAEAKLAQLLRLWQQRIAQRRDDEPGSVHVFAAHVQIRGSLTSGGEVLAGQEIELTPNQIEELGADYGAIGHLHRQQEPAPRCWYAGSLWRQDFGEVEPYKGWNLVDIGPTAPVHADYTDDLGRVVCAQSGRPAEGGRHALTVIPRPSKCRRVLTLDYRWDAAPGASVASWHTEPGAERLALARGAYVRVRLTVPQQWVASCPLDERVAALDHPHQVVVERKIEPALRMRAPEVAAATTTAAKLAAYWGTLATSPSDVERAQALAQLGDLEAQEDEQIGTALRALVE